MRRLLLRVLLVLFALLLVLQGLTLARALWQLQVAAFRVSDLLWGALVFKALLLLLNAAVLACLWRLSGLGRAGRLPP